MALCFDHSLYVRFLPDRPEEKGRGETLFTTNIGFASVFILAAVLGFLSSSLTKMLMSCSNILVFPMQLSVPRKRSDHLFFVSFVWEELRPPGPQRGLKQALLLVCNQSLSLLTRQRQKTTD